MPIARSGHSTQRTNTIFLAPDDADQAEGFAGQAWARGCIVQNLNPLPELASNATEKAIAEYARESWMTPKAVKERVDAGKCLPQAMCGIPIFLKKSTPWGVIVVDSRRSNGIKSFENNVVTYEITQKLLEKLLSKD